MIRCMGGCLILKNVCRLVGWEGGRGLACLPCKPQCLHSKYEERGFDTPPLPHLSLRASYRLYIKRRPKTNLKVRNDVFKVGNRHCITIAGINIKHIQKPNFRNITVTFFHGMPEKIKKGRRLFGMKYKVRICVQYTAIYLLNFFPLQCPYSYCRTLYTHYMCTMESPKLHQSRKIGEILHMLKTDYWKNNVFEGRIKKKRILSLLAYFNLFSASCLNQ